MDNLIQLPNTINLISKHWVNAENYVREEIFTNHHEQHDEKNINFLLNGALRKEFEKLNKSKDLEKEFKIDLQKQFNERKYSLGIKSISDGIVVRVSYHEGNYYEGVSGADFGLVISRPDITLTKQDNLVCKMHKQGLLIQAKRQQKSYGLGELTKSQKKRIKNYLSFFSLLLYFYNDPYRRDLKAFSWNINTYDSVEKITHFLKNYDNHSSKTILKNSEEVIFELGHGQIGTNNKKLIETIICPEEMPHIIIEIIPPDTPPDSGGGGNGLVSSHVLPTSTVTSTGARPRKTNRSSKQYKEFAAEAPIYHEKQSPLIEKNSLELTNSLLTKKELYRSSSNIQNIFYFLKVSGVFQLTLTLPVTFFYLNKPFDMTLRFTTLPLSLFLVNAKDGKEKILNWTMIYE